MNRGDEVVEALRELVTSGAYARGDRLPPERELAARFGVSRPVLREAVSALSQSGLLEARRGSGTYVARVNPQDVFALRLRLEPLAAELAARRRTDAQAVDLAARQERLAAAIADPAAFARHDQDIHAAVATAAASPLVEEVLARIADVIVVSRSVTMFSIRTRRATARDLGTLVAAIAAGDPDAAAAAMERHLTVVQEQVAA